MPGASARFGPMHAMRSFIARSSRGLVRGRMAFDMCGPVSGGERPRTAVAAIVGGLKSLNVRNVPLVNEFFLASNCEIASERARRCGLAPLPHPVGCRWQWYISNLLFHGDSNKIIPPTWRARHHVPPELTAMHALYVCAHGCVKHIYSGVGE